MSKVRKELIFESESLVSADVGEALIQVEPDVVKQIVSQKLELTVKW